MTKRRTVRRREVKDYPDATLVAACRSCWPLLSLYGASKAFALGELPSRIGWFRMAVFDLWYWYDSDKPIFILYGGESLLAKVTGIFLPESMHHNPNGCWIRSEARLLCRLLNLASLQVS